MARPRNPVPTYRFHRQSGQAVCTIHLPGGGTQDVLLGKHNSPESKREYERLLGKLRAGAAAPKRGSDLSINEVLLRFWQHALAHYRRPDGSRTSEVDEYRATIRVVRELYGTKSAEDFGPLAVKAVRQRMIDLGWSRGVVNARVRRVKHVLKWAAAEELIPSSVYAAVATVSGLQRGRSGVRDPEPVGPVEDWAVRLTLPHLLPELAAMVEVQRLCGCRPGEVCAMRPANIDRSGDVWLYRPVRHKTAWRGKPRVIAIGPRAQAILNLYWPANPEENLFSPSRAVAGLHARRSAARTTPLYPSHMRRNVEKRVRVKRRPPSAGYTTASYGKAVARAVKAANRERHTLLDGVHGPYLPVVPHWQPNQLRHAAATLIRQRCGLEAAQATLGHTRADVTQVYAERDLGLAVRVAIELG
jgi:integrase